MVLNNIAQMFSIWFPVDFFLPEVVEQWEPYIKRLKLPYMTLTDFMNAQIQGVSYPSIDIGSSEQQQGQFPIQYTVGKEMEPLLNKDFTITFKLTESYLTYWILFDQTRWFLEYTKRLSNNTLLFMEDINITFLNDAGFSMVNYKYKQIIPKSLGNFNLSYASQLAQYTTIDWGLHYNRMDVSFDAAQF